MRHYNSLFSHTHTHTHIPHIITFLWVFQKGAGGGGGGARGWRRRGGTCSGHARRTRRQIKTAEGPERNAFSTPGAGPGGSGGGGGAGGGGGGGGGARMGGEQGGGEVESETARFSVFGESSAEVTLQPPSPPGT